MTDVILSLSENDLSENTFLKNDALYLAFLHFCQRDLNISLLFWALLAVFETHNILNDKFPDLLLVNSHMLNNNNNNNKKQNVSHEKERCTGPNRYFQNWAARPVKGGF